MVLVAKKWGVRLTKNHGTLVRLLHKDGKADSFHFIDNSCRQLKCVELKKLPLPLSFRDLPYSERMTFSKERNRDTLGMYITAFSSSSYGNENDVYPDERDSRIDKYTCSGLVDLSSSMQTNVPQPFSARVRPTHLNMPRGQWRQEAKYISEQLHNFHYLNIRCETPFAQSKRFCSSENKISGSEEIAKSVGHKSSNGGKGLTKSEKLKAAIKEYGTTFLVLHISISLVSLGMCYVLIRSGIDIEEIIKEYGWSDGAGVVASAGPFIVAYAVHKIFAPFRIGLTLSILPFVVHFLRKRGFKIKGK